MAKSSPLHRVIDAGRWDAERPLGGLIVFVHAAFLDAGFVPHPHGAAKASSRSGRRTARQAGLAAASTISLRYTAPQLAHRRDDAEAAVLRMNAHGGQHVVFYVRTGRRPADGAGAYECACLDALADAAILSGGLDDTARALRGHGGDARVAALWSELAGGICRRLFVDVCRRCAVPLEPSFMSLPGDVKALILGKLASGKDLARAESTCTEMRLLVADRDGELWKPRFRALVRGKLMVGSDEEMSWKERYVRADRRCASWKKFTPSWIWVRELRDYRSELEASNELEADLRRRRGLKDRRA